MARNKKAQTEIEKAEEKKFELSKEILEAARQKEADKQKRIYASVGKFEIVRN